MDKKILSIVLALVAAISSPIAMGEDSNRSAFELGVKQTSDDLHWNIASDLSGTVTPNVLSELQYFDIAVSHVYAKGELVFFDRLSIGGMFDYGTITDGDSIDSDYFGNNRTNVFSISNADVDGDNTTEAILSVGWHFNFGFEIPVWRMRDENRMMALASNIRITPNVGYLRQTQDIRVVNGVQVFPDLGPFPGLNTQYDSVWSGAFAGVSGQFDIAGPLSLTFDFKYVPGLAFRSEAVWNLRADFRQDPSFRQSAEGNGKTLDVGLSWAFGRDRSKVVTLGYTDTVFDATDGVDETFFSDGDIIAIRLNHVARRSHGWSLGFNWRF